MTDDEPPYPDYVFVVPLALTGIVMVATMVWVHNQIVVYGLEAVFAGTVTGGLTLFVTGYLTQAVARRLWR